MWHCRLNHLPFIHMFKLSEQGYLPKRFLLFNNNQYKLYCPSCIFAKMKRRPWRHKGQYRPIRRENENAPGIRVSVDQVVSQQPGLIGIIEGIHTRKIIYGVTVFKDHFTNLSYSYFNTSLNTEEKIQSKFSFEQFSTSNGVNVHAYHADNGRFAEKGFRDAVQLAGQKLTYCGVGTHNQNGIVERHIQELTMATRSLILHAQQIWPEVISTLLWPFAWSAAEYQYNNLRFKNGKSPMQNYTNNTCSRLNIVD